MKKLAVAAAVLLVVVCLSACTRTDQKSSGPAEKVTIAFATPPFTVLADLAQMQGYFKQEGLEVTPIFHSTGRAALGDVLHGKADFATAAETPVMFAIMKGAKISVITTIQTSNRVHAVCARKDNGISTPQDLRGKRIGAALGTSIEFFMDAFLVSNGISRRDVKVVNLTPEEMPAAVARGDVDAISTFSPFLGDAQKNLGDKGVTFHNDEIYTQIFNIVAAQEYVKIHPETVKKLLRALIKAEELVKRNPEEARKTVADFRKADKGLFDNIGSGDTFEVSLDQQLVLSLEDESRWAIKAGLTKRTDVPNYLDFIYLDGMLSVRPKAVTILR